MNETSKKVSVLFLINDITALGGTERMCTMIANELSAAGFDVAIISRHEGKLAPFFPLDKAIHREQLFAKSPVKLHHLILPFAISRVVKQHQPDLIISCDTQMCLYSAIPLLKKNHIAWEHFNSEICTRFGSRWFGRRMASLMCKKIIVLTNSDKQHWINTLQASPQKIAVIPNPLPVTRVDHVQTSGRQNIVLAVGRMTAQKGFDLLIQSWAKIDQASTIGWKLRIVGPNGSAKPELERLIKTLKLENNVELISESNNIESEYKHASMYVMSSRYEGFGLTLIEAMGQGLPVIAFDCPMGPSEIIADQFGKLLPHHDIDTMAKTIECFLLDPSLRAQFGELAHRRSKDYTPDIIIHKWTSMIHQL